MATNQNPVPESMIPEVAAFVEAQERISRLKESYPEIFEQLDILKDDYNTALEAAEKAVRAQKVSCGPFTLISIQTKYDAEKLYEAVGRDAFLRFGGIEKSVTVFSVDKSRLEAAIAANAVPSMVVEDVKDVSPRFKKPEKIVI
jgi:hypothetical protein